MSGVFISLIDSTRETDTESTGWTAFGFRGGVYRSLSRLPNRSLTTKYRVTRWKIAKKWTPDQVLYWWTSLQTWHDGHFCM